MSEEFVRKWIDALRSGEYKQGRHRLRDCDDRFCCLGVACDIHPNTSWLTHLNPVTNKVAAHWVEGGIEYLPCEIATDFEVLQPVEEWDFPRLIASLPRGFLKERNRFHQFQYILAELNDTYGWDFNQIADWLEQNLLPLLKENARNS